MSSIASNAVVFGGAFLRMFLRKLLPQNHLGDDSKGIRSSTFATAVRSRSRASFVSAIERQRLSLQEG
jgi:hypothetical protein